MFTFWDWVMITAAWSLIPLMFWLKHRQDKRFRKMAAEDEVACAKARAEFLKQLKKPVLDMTTKGTK